VGYPVTFVIVGSGPSLTPADVAACRGRARVIVVNDSYMMAPWADYLYARDYDWWVSKPTYYDKPQHEATHFVFEGERWTGSQIASQTFSLRYVQTRSALGLCPIPGVIHDGKEGANSGYQAINLAIHFGARRILLLGFDMGATGRGHWFGAHPTPLTNVEANEYGVFARVFDSMTDDLRNMGIEVVNCTRKSAITCFRCSTIEQELHGPDQGDGLQNAGVSGFLN